MINLSLIIDSSTSSKLVADIINLKPNKILLFEINENLTFRKKLLQKIPSSCVVKKIDLNKKKLLSSINLKNAYVEFVGKLSSLKIDSESKQTLVEFLRLGNLSYWWLTTIAEKNPLKRDAYLKINTLYNLISTIKDNESKSIFIDIQDRELSSAIVVNLDSSHFILKNKKAYPNFIYFIYSIFNAGILLLKLIGRSVICKIFYKEANILKTPSPFTLISTLPSNILKNQKNPYFQTIIEEMVEKELKYKELFMLNGFNLSKNISTLKYLKLSSMRDYDLLDRYIGLTDIISLLVKYIYLSSKLFKVKNVLRRNLYFEGINIYNLLIGDIFISMVGQQAIENLYNSALFKHYFRMNKAKSCYLYPLEMQAWEKILNTQKNIINKDIVTNGIQHVPIPFLMLNYFYSKIELEGNISSKAMPTPDKALLFSDMDYQLFKEMGWEEDKISNFGSIRFHKFTNDIESKWSQKDNSVAIIFPGNRSQCIELVEYLKPVISYLHSINFYISPHPDNDEDLKNIFKNLTKLDNCFSSALNTIDLMKKSKILVSYGTSTILGGIINHCSIIIPVLSSSLPLDPAFNKIHKIKFITDQEKIIKEINMIIYQKDEPVHVADLFKDKDKYINLSNKKMYIHKLTSTSLKE